METQQQKEQQVQPDTQVEGFWFITSLIVVILIVMVVGIILFLVYVFTGDIFSSTACRTTSSNTSVQSTDLITTDSQDLQTGGSDAKREDIEKRETQELNKTRKLECANYRRSTLGFEPVVEFDVTTNTLTELEMSALLKPVLATPSELEQLPQRGLLEPLPDPLQTEALRTAALPLFEAPKGFSGLILANGKQFLKINRASFHDKSIRFQYTYIASQSQSLVPRLRYPSSKQSKHVWQGPSFEMKPGNSQIHAFPLSVPNFNEKTILELLHMPSEKVMASTFVAMGNDDSNIVSNTSPLNIIEPPLKT